MSKTTAERQAEYRARRAFAGIDGNGERRLNTWISTSAAMALARLAAHQGVSQRAFLEQMLVSSDELILKRLASDDEQWGAYMNLSPLRSNDA